MNKLKIFYVITIILLGLLLVSTMSRPINSDVKYSEVQRRQLVQAEGEWILKFDILNREGKDTNYTINSTVGNRPYVEYVTIQDAGMYTYVQHVRPGNPEEKGLSFAVYKEGEGSPFEEATYSLR
ncbi:MAG: hypothetical protein HYX79_04150 [Chloroflexi bacterium]|nr:hypothetical protein [Chloroflexota bacterium]